MGSSASSSLDWARDCAAVIPCFNEEPDVGAVVRSVQKYLPTVFVVDDGSADNTAIRAADIGAVVIRNAVNHGKGSALRTGLSHARAQGFAWALTMDGDGQHVAIDIPGFFSCAERTGAALVVGNRLGTPEKIPPLRRLVNRLMTKILSRLTGTSLADSQCGFRLINLDDWAKLTVTTDHFETESELLVQFIRAGHRIDFVPVQVIYESGRSKIRPVLDTCRWLRWWMAQ